MLPRVNLVRTDSADFLLFSTDDAVSKTIYSTGTWASPLLAISKMFYQDEAAPFIMDIGANLGAYTIPIAKDVASMDGMVYAYEPQRIVFYQLCGNAFLNRLDNVFPFNMAIGDTEGSVLIPSINYKDSKNIGGFTLDQDAHSHLGPVAIDGKDQGHAVRLACLDNLDVPKSPSLIKIDVEGLELQVLKGAVKFLEKHQYPPMLLEAWNLDWFQERRKELLDFLAHLGYECFAIQDELIAQHPLCQRQIQFKIEASTIQMARVR
ncbi:FkbM family methyltransferase [Rhodoferax saidenbachensis]|uniref:Methyltransferase FkbM domain-containing protein n=1 Tax=Rhodoferax saidenbachensis TaxID=1484693 RepID=A0A1P8K6H7_9BURK|nr:FkbM family methyltransferase [Rhodoferax saidenbachensis]APW41603.1 hypothetical protein RS694_02890 [Rhodoferax saidenbachensis]